MSPHPSVDEPAQARPRRSVRSATLWSYGLTLGKLLITTGLTLVLAAMLGPRAFGVIAMALVFVNLIEMLQQQGLMPAIITRRDLRDDHADTAFWLVIGVGVVCTAAGILLAPFWASFNQLPELTPVIQVLALGVPITSSVVVHQALLRRDLDFKALAVRSWLAAIAGGVAGIAGAIAGWGVWALVTQQLVMNVVGALVLWRASRWRPRLRFRIDAARDLWSYSVRSASSSVGVFVGGRIDVLLAGAFFGPVVVGLYRLGQRLTAMVVDVTARSMQSVSLPGLAAVQAERTAFEARLLTMQRLTAALALPALGLLVGLAPLVPDALGPEWSSTSVAIQLLALGQAASAVSLLLGPALQAHGRPGVLAVIVWVWGAMTAVSLALVAAWAPDDARDQLAVLCSAVSASAIVAGGITVVVSSRVFAIPLHRMVRSWLPGVAGGAAAALSSSTFVGTARMSWIIEIALAGTAGATAAMIAIAVFDQQARSFLRHPSQARRLMGRK